MTGSQKVRGSSPLCSTNEEEPSGRAVFLVHEELGGYSNPKYPTLLNNKFATNILKYSENMLKYDHETGYIVWLCVQSRTVRLKMILDKNIGR